MLTVLMLMVSAVLFVSVIYLGSRISAVEMKLEELLGSKSARSENTNIPQTNPVPVPSTPAVSTTPQTIEPNYSEPQYNPVTPTSTFVPQVATEAHGLEFRFGSQIFTIVGTVAVLFGVGFFLRYAFENNLISEAARVGIGVVAGAILLVIGEVARRRYAVYGQMLCGLGIGVLYLSFYAAYNFYSLVSLPSAFIAMAIVTALGLWLAVRHNSPPLAFVAMIGGFLTPFLLSSGENHPHALFLYIALLDIGVLAVAMWRRWRELTLINFIGTVLVYAMWYWAYGDNAAVFIAEAYAALFWVIFFLLPILQSVALGQTEDDRDLGLVVLDAAWFMVTTYVVLKPHYNSLLSAITAILALLYLGTALLFSEGKHASKRLSSFFTDIGFVLLVLVIPIQFHQHWITIGWAAEALALAYIGYDLRSRHIRVLSYIVSLITLLRFLFIDLTVPVVTPFFNAHMFVFAFVLACFVLTNILHWIKRAEVASEEIGVRTFIMLETILLLVWAPSSEVYAFHAAYWIAVVWCLGAVAAVMAGIAMRDTIVRVSGYTIMGAAFLHVFVADSTVKISTYVPFFNSRVGVSLFVLLVMGAIAFLIRHASDTYIEEDERKVIPQTLAIMVNCLIFWIVSWEVVDYFNRASYLYGGTSELTTHYDSLKRAMLSIAWIIYAIALLGVGILAKSAVARFSSIVAFVLAILKVFLFDTATLSDFYRFISFIALGFILLLTGFLYYRFQDRISGFLRASS